MAGRLRRVLLEEFATLTEIKRPRFPEALKMERVRRVELPTLCLASIRSSQLSYTRITNFLSQHRCFVNFAAPARPFFAGTGEKIERGN